MAAGEDQTKAIVRDLFVLKVSNKMADRCSEPAHANISIDREWTLLRCSRPGSLRSFPFPELSRFQYCQELLTDPGTVLFIQRILVGFIATEDQQSGSVFVQVPIDLRKAHGYARIEIGAARSYLDAGSVWAQVK